MSFQTSKARIIQTPVVAPAAVAVQDDVPVKRLPPQMLHVPDYKVRPGVEFIEVINDWITALIRKVASQQAAFMMLPLSYFVAAFFNRGFRVNPFENNWLSADIWTGWFYAWIGSLLGLIGVAVALGVVALALHIISVALGSVVALIRR